MIAGQPITLRFIAGPVRDPVTLEGSRDRWSVGRSADSDICLLHEGVSRRHATLVRSPDGLVVVHHAQRSSTRLNGERLDADKPTPVGAGDVLSFGPCTCRVSIGPLTRRGVEATMDGGLAVTQKIEVLGVRGRATRTARRLGLLSDWIAKLAQPRTIIEAAELAVSAALDGGGFPRAAVLVPDEAGLGFELLAARASDGSDCSSLRFSQSLLEPVRQGQVAVLRDDSKADRAVSLAEMGVHTALGVPVMVGDQVEACLYLDARGGESTVDAEAIGFCEAVARGLALALGEAKRRDLERRQGELSAQLSAARDVQERLFPPGTGRVGPLRYAVLVRPGEYVAGDLFDAMELDGGAAAVMVGDATGHGAGSGMMMAMAQSFLHAQLRRTQDPAEAVRAANAYLADRAAGGRFVSLWLGVFERDGTVRYVDAGHGHWMRLAADGSRAREPVGTAVPGIPLGIDHEFPYESESLTLGPGERLLLYTDGVVERRGSGGDEFGADRLVEASHAGDETEACRRVFDAGDAFAGTVHLLDDATVAVVRMAE